MLARYPQLEIVEQEPPWMTKGDRRRLRERMTLDIDDTSHPFLRSLADHRPQPLDASLQ
jgi:hypothetical protein